ncbi:hypothetical protein RF11_07434 [Thelohanellus kitauei]|uniref:Uncharacterized protein n=1 Tax=Thelohanellus kitauei TaxID=669202 RepID=A0A0C2NLK8_THEKT|nr:hypothetical protein RF11_07434 [Thelohanellus kitauei]
MVFERFCRFAFSTPPPTLVNELHELWHDVLGQDNMSNLYFSVFFIYSVLSMRDLAKAGVLLLEKGNMWTNNRQTIGHEPLISRIEGLEHTCQRGKQTRDRSGRQGQLVCAMATLTNALQDSRPIGSQAKRGGSRSSHKDQAATGPLKQKSLYRVHVNGTSIFTTTGQSRLSTDLSSI